MDVFLYTLCINSIFVLFIDGYFYATLYFNIRYFNTGIETFPPTDGSDRRKGNVPNRDEVESFYC